MRLRNLFKTAIKKSLNVPIKGISFDSRLVKKKDVFFAINGQKVSGHKFINHALIKGAAAIVSEKKEGLKKISKPVLIVNDVRKSLAEACSNYYKRKPSKIIAVTGTNGKSSVADFFYQILNFNNISVASIGTLGIISKKYKKKTNLTSIDSLSLHKSLEILDKNKVKNVILEASSHGLDQKRIDFINIDIGIFTNLSHDHLDYHENMKSYLNSKLHLFNKLLKRNAKVIINQENKEYKIIKNIAKKRKLKEITIGQNFGTIKILSHSYNKNAQDVKILIDSKIYFLKIPLIGYFQVKNLLLAMLAALSCGLKKDEIFTSLSKIKPVNGRLECVANLDNNSKIIIDFAHTPDALEQTLIALRDHYKKEIVLIFGCGGDRDKKKRPVMGRIAKKYCKKIIITDDNPRNENPKKIRESILQGCNNSAIDIGSRKKALKIGIEQLEANEILLVAGKGHEQIQDYGKKIFNFSDKKIIKKIVRNNIFLSNKKSWYQNNINEAFKKKINNINYEGVSINTKNLKKNNLFFAIKGKKTDGHKFLKHALRLGAVKSVISKNLKGVSERKVIKVKDTFMALNQLAKTTRANSSAKIIGITGSVGKTTVKNLLAHTLKNYGKVCYSPHSYNNKYGVPLSISNLKKDTDYGVFEVGMDKKGEIDNLSKIIKPELAIITNIAEAHFKNFKNIKDIAKAKAEIINNILKGGYVILNKDSNFFNFLSSRAKKNKIKIISYGIKKKSNIYFLGKKKIKDFYRIKVLVEDKKLYFDIRHNSESFISNMLACISILYVLNLNLNKSKNFFMNFSIPPGRGDRMMVNKFNKSFKFVDESYNANPLSMNMAIKNINTYKNSGKKVVLLGDMLELGKKSKKFHKKLSLQLNKSNIDKVFVYGNHIKETFKFLSENKKGKIFNNLGDAYNHFSNILRNNDILMVKGSHATGLNIFAKNIKHERKESAL
jgi:MurE/MurF fusion protein